MKLAEGSFVTAIKGYLIGAANVVPGVSGGTFALITGIYQRTIDALSAILSLKSCKLLFGGRGREFWKAIDGGFLVALAIGIVVSVFTLARLITFTLANFFTDGILSIYTNDPAVHALASQYVRINSFSFPWRPGLSFSD